MAQELSYVVVNPHTIYKSRTGGVIARLLTRSTLDLVGGMMFAPSKALANEFADVIARIPDAHDKAIQTLLSDYVRENYAPHPVTQQRQRVMVLLFKGENAVERLRNAIGKIKYSSASGETVRDTYGDLVYNHDGSVRYFEPAVITAFNAEEARIGAGIWAKYAESDGGLLENVAATHPEPNHQRTLVIIKPDNFKFPSGRPGNVIDLFSKTGLSITGLKVHRMTVAEAEEFYGPVREILRDVLRGPTAARARELLQSVLPFSIPGEVETSLGNLLGPLAGDEQFQTIVKFMAGRSPRECPAQERDEPGSEKCIILIYEGLDAVAKIREVLGPTDPAKAPPGSIRREFGQTIMINAAHASDSPENAIREMGIVKIRRNNFKGLIEQAHWA